MEITVNKYYFWHQIEREGGEFPHHVKNALMYYFFQDLFEKIITILNCTYYVVYFYSLGAQDTPMQYHS